MMKKHLWILVLIPSLLFAGCAKPPEQDMAQADEAMQAAMAAQAEVYAQTDHALAQDALSKAQAEVEAQKAKFALFRNYGEAKSLFAAAIDQSNKAKEAAIVNKEAVKNEATTLIAEAKTAVDDAAKALKSAPRGKDTKAEIDAMNADLASLQGMLPELDNAMAAEQYMDARNKATSVKEKAMSIKTEVDEAKAKMKGRR
ncbi:MAG: hypothetical protein A3I06_08825, partial [Candidatus Lindowbacteria bacterium RIFCSPLOWO2_02_FULL_62_12]